LIKLGLVGCGRAAERLYLPTLLRLKGARLVAVADPYFEERPFIAKSAPGCVLYNSVEALLKEVELMGLIIASPPDTHIELIKLALLAGLPVLVEKPLALNSSEIEELRVHLLDSTKKVMMGFNRRFWEPACRMRRELLFNNYVEPVLVKLVLESNIQEWGAYSGASDPLEDLGPHQFDLLRYLFNRELVAVNARWVTRSVIHVDVELEDGIMAECLAAHGNGYREHVTVQYKHHRYQIRMDSERMRPAKGVFRWILDRYDWMHRLRNRDQPPMLLSYERQLTHFINCIRRGVFIPKELTAD
jgi:myo-inositol 2-dehydrogenase/D-chiro-inositol 1-dehydrogenase